MNINEVDSQLQSSLDNISNVWMEAKEYFSKGNEELKQEIQELENKNKDLEQKYNEAQAKLDKIEGQLANTVEQMKSMSKATDKGIDAMELLDVYLILMEKVFESQVHTRLLIILHGNKEVFSINDLATAAGTSGIEVRRAIADLRNADIVDFNEDTDEVELKMRFMD